MKVKIGITGQAGFIGTHLYNTFGLFPDRYERISFEDEFFNDNTQLNKFVSKCDVIVHLAAVNRHKNQQVLYETNVKLVKQLLSACEKTSSKPHVLFSSSIQESNDNYYGRSKKEGRRLLEEWAKKNNAHISGLIIPNVFGPFGQPHYNSVVATFCYQLTHEETPQIDMDGEVGLIYVNDLASRIISIIEERWFTENNLPQSSAYQIEPTNSIRVSSLLEKLTSYRDTYFRKGVIPDLSNQFNLNLFNTFVCYINHAKFFPFYLTAYTDSRGSFVETVKLNSGGQVSFSTTLPGITRGNHYHTRKAERFAVIKGKARIELRKIGSNKKISFILDGDKPSFVDMPIWYTHNITNIGDEELFTVFWINEHYNSDDPDTYYEVV